MQAALALDCMLPQSFYWIKIDQEICRAQTGYREKRSVKIFPLLKPNSTNEHSFLKTEGWGQERFNTYHCPVKLVSADDLCALKHVFSRSWCNAQLVLKSQENKPTIIIWWWWWWWWWWLMIIIINRLICACLSLGFLKPVQAWKPVATHPPLPPATFTEQKYV